MAKRVVVAKRVVDYVIRFFVDPVPLRSTENDTANAPGVNC